MDTNGTPPINGSTTNGDPPVTVLVDCVAQLLTVLADGGNVFDNQQGCYIGFADSGRILLYMDRLGVLQHRSCASVTNFPMMARAEKVYNG